MEFWEHRPEDLITKQMNVNYNPQATCPKWVAFLNKIFDQNQELIEYVQKAVGYSLTGDTGEDCLFVLYGTGQNGKTTFVKTLEDIWGDYAINTPVETFLAKQTGYIPSDIARLAGTRLAMAIEAPEGRSFNEVMIKQLTGRDTITARFLYQGWFDFETTFKIFIATNHKPVVRENSIAFWRRMRVLPFIVQITDEEKIEKYEKILLEEREGIFNWALEGFLKWQEEGLGIPKEVQLATQEYRDQMDVLGEFIEEKCVEDSIAKTTNKDLYGTYSKWCEENNEKPIDKRVFGRRLEERGYKAIRIGHKRERGWQGIGLKNNADIEDII
jgi:putative DNA primase/helicase